VEDSSFEDDQLASMTTEDITRKSRLLDNEIRILKVIFLSLSLYVAITTAIIMFDLSVFLLRVQGCFVYLGFWFC
jgi:hypothetical protein